MTAAILVLAVPLAIALGGLCWEIREEKARARRRPAQNPQEAEARAREAAAPNPSYFVLMDSEGREQRP